MFASSISTTFMTPVTACKHTCRHFFGNDLRAVRKTIHPALCRRPIRFYGETPVSPV